jgi:hypothetical protein
MQVTACINRLLRDGVYNRHQQERMTVKSRITLTSPGPTTANGPPYH